VAIILFAPSFAICQGGVAPATNCKGTQFSPNKLENNQDVLTAANTLAIDLVTNFDAKNPNVAPNIESVFVPFHLVTLAAADCAQQISSGTAQAVTSQTNKQLGATASSDGSTSAVEKTGITQLLGVAVEDGAVTNDVTGNTMTLSTSAYGLAAGAAYVLSGGRILDTQDKYASCSFCVMIKTGASATFNITNTSDALANATRKQVSQWQLKYSFLDKSIRSEKVADFYNKDLPAASYGLTNNLSALDLAAISAPMSSSLQAAITTDWTKELQAATDKAKTDNSAVSDISDLATKILQYLDSDSDYQSALSSAMANPILTDKATRYATALLAYSDAYKKFTSDIENLAKGFNGDVTFGQQFPTTTSSSTSSTSSTTSASAMPSYLVSGLDLSWEPKTKDDTAPAPAGGAGAAAKTKQPTPIDPLPSWTANFAGSFYPNPKTTLNETTFRGATAALQAQWSLGSGPFVKDPNNKSQVTFAISGKYQRLQENQHQAGKKADIALGNFKLEIPISSGVSFPLSVSFANAAEQVKETYVRGDFGISFDLDKLAALLQATKQ
jgi:hypothetical protein